MFLEILMKFGEKCGDLLYKFLSILMEILYYFYISFWENFRGIVENICNYWYRYGYRYQRKVLILIDTGKYR